MSYSPVSYEVFVREFGQLVWDDTLSAQAPAPAPGRRVLPAEAPCRTRCRVCVSRVSGGLRQHHDSARSPSLVRQLPGARAQGEGWAVDGRGGSAGLYACMARVGHDYVDSR